MGGFLFMRYNLEFFVIVEVELFEQWLNRFCIKTFSKIIQRDEQKDIALHTPLMQERTYSDGIRRFFISGSRFSLDPNNPHTAIHEPDFKILFVEIDKVRNGRLEVKIRFTLREILEDIIVLAKEIKKRYPDTEPDINRFLIEHGAMEDMPIQSGTDLTPADVQKPWEKIPNVSWYREAVKLWHDSRYGTKEIAIKLGKKEQTVRNKIAELRSLYGEDVVPYRRK